MILKLKTLVEEFSLQPQSSFDDDFVVTGVNTLKNAAEGELSFFTNKKYRSDLFETRASAVLLEEPVAGCKAIQLVVKNPYAVLARILQKMFPEHLPPPAIHPTAVISDKATIGENCYIGPHCIVSDDAVIGPGTSLMGNCHVGKGSTLGEKCVLYPSVTLYHHVHLGDRVRVHANSVIGSDGFGYAQDNGVHIKIPQLGGVRIEHDVEIGSNTSIDRGAQLDTIIGEGTKIDNCVQIGHGVQTGKHCLLIAQTGIAGSTMLGNHVIFAGQSGAVGHLKIGDKTAFMVRAVATKDTPKPGYYAGFPARPADQHHREKALIRRMDRLRKKVCELEKCLKK
ncbi:MAG: UDP-3-O-(3-hydroxymyristoyl)glucosamine N-acyltransferase [Acidobacteria bacterium]|nr:MAG: UDP-3-O-(3-hydroxymyristoyl)glucosamine N-acyltransferase [Acidobacteriota bacterium]